MGPAAEVGEREGQSEWPFLGRVRAVKARKGVYAPLPFPDRSVSSRPLWRSEAVSDFREAVICSTGANVDATPLYCRSANSKDRQLGGTRR